MRETRGGIDLAAIRRMEWTELVRWWIDLRDLIEVRNG